MAPAGLAISKVGVQATASSESVKAVLCLKISLPREGEGRQASRWGLFSSIPPKLLSAPSLHSLPISIPWSTSPTTLEPALRIASTLLSMPPPKIHPPSPTIARGAKAFLDVSSTTGQVYLCVDPILGSRQTAKKNDDTGVRQEWLVVIEFEVDVENIEGGLSKVLLPLAKCLDNVIRFQILSPRDSSSTATGEVSILTEPKMLPLPSTAFLQQHDQGCSSHSTRRRKSQAGFVGAEEGWEDGEDLGPDDRESEQSENEIHQSDSTDSRDEGGESWLEGRFQSTDALRLEWSFKSTSAITSTSVLNVLPHWDVRHPSIHLSYEAFLPSEDMTVPIEVVFPDGWGWSQLSLQGDSLTGWRSVDGGWWDEMAYSADPIAEDDVTMDSPGHDTPFSTIRGRQSVHIPTRASSHSSASLLRQTMPTPSDIKMMDFSFELKGLDLSPSSRPGSMSGKHTTIPLPLEKTPPATNRRRESRDPLPGRLFDLSFCKVSEKSFVLQGTLVPLSPLTLVSSAASYQLPFVRIDNSTAHAASCLVTCPFARYGGKAHTSASHLCDVSQPRIGTFTWRDAHDRPVTSRKSLGVRGDIRVMVQQSSWGLRTMTVLLPWPRRVAEIVFTLSGNHSVRIQRATLSGVAMPRSLTVSDEETEVRLGATSKEGMAEIVLEAGVGKDEVALPRFQGANGTMIVVLRGEGWEGVKGNLASSSTGPLTFTYDLSSPEQPLLILVPSQRTTIRKTHSRTIFSYSAFVNLFMLWLLVSMGQQVQRLRNEVAFVTEDARDLRLYGMGLTPTAPTGLDLPDTPMIRSDSEGMGMRTALAKTRNKMSTALGRVVFGPTSWESWIRHPTVRTVSKGMSWLWHAVIRLVTSS